MSPHAILPLDSYRLAQYAMPIACYICDGDNHCNAELCRHCQAPMALAYQAEALRVRPKMIAALGPSGAGKSVYLGMLMDMLSRQNHELHALARGAFSIAIQQNTIAALSEGRFPKRTPREPEGWNWLHCQVTPPKRRKQIELIIPDMSGEAIQADIEHAGTYPVVRTFLAWCNGLLMMLDGREIAGGDSSQEFFAMKMITTLCERAGHRRRGWPNRPVAVIFTKADPLGSCFADPGSYAKRHLPGFWQQCQDRLGRHAFFACNVVGACASRLEADGRVQIPLRVEPYGVVEPFQWLVNQLAK